MGANFLGPFFGFVICLFRVSVLPGLGKAMPGRVDYQISCKNSDLRYEKNVEGSTFYIFLFQSNKREFRCMKPWFLNGRANINEQGQPAECIPNFFPSKQTKNIFYVVCIFCPFFRRLHLRRHCCCCRSKSSET